MTSSGADRFMLVTGASLGIGRELALVGAERGHNLILVARSEDKLATLADEIRTRESVQVEVLSSDLSRPEAPEQLFHHVSRLGVEIETLVNNAGFGSLGAFHETAIETQLEMLRLNVATVTHLTHLFLPAMIERGRGRILNVASTAGLQPGPFMAVYYASKAYVLSFSEALAEELRGTGVTVTALCPGPVRTGFQARAAMQGSPLTRMGMAEPRQIAETGYRAMMQGKAVVIPGLMNRILALVVRLSPRSMVRRVVRTLNRSA